MHFRIPAAILLTAAAVALPMAQQPVEKLDYATIAQIRDEGLNRSQVMDHISWLSDVYGPRLTGGPGIMQASDWAIKKFGEWGLVNAHRETWAFGKGWSLVRFSAHMIEPQVQPLIGFPGSWSPGTNGPVVAEVVRVQIDSEADFEKYRGKLAGKIVLTQPERAVTMLDGTIVHRMGEKELEEAATMPIPRPRAGGPGRGRGGDPADDDPAGRGRGGAQALRGRITQFFKAEGVVATFDRGGDTVMASVGSDLSFQQQRTDGGTIFPTGNQSRGADAGTGVPSVTLAVEHYNRMVRILAKNIPVKVELNLETKFYDETTPNGFNTVAEIPGTDPVLKDEVVILGAHFDSVAAATGATDNATGSAAMMEAMRILKADRREAAPDDSRRALGRRRGGAARIARLRARALRRPGDDGAQARAREGRGLLQLRQRHRPRPRRVDAEQPRRAADLRAVDRAAQGPRRRRARTALGLIDRSRVVRQRGPARLPVHGGPARIPVPHASFDDGRRTTACSATTWSSRRPSSRCSPTTPRCATRSCRARRFQGRSRKGEARTNGALRASTPNLQFPTPKRWR